MDGEYHTVKFHQSAAARDVMEIVKKKEQLNLICKGNVCFNRRLEQNV
jgi:hypothetical protein